MTDYRALCAELLNACETLYKQSVTTSHHQTITLSNGEHPIPMGSDILAQDAVFSYLLHRARAALAEQQGEGPSHGDICQWLERHGHWGDNAHRIPRIANIVQDALARWGHPAPALNQVFAGPTTGTDVNAPHFSFLTADDLPKQPVEIERREAPPAEGEVVELVELLHKEAADDEIGDHMLWMTPADARRAAELLQQQQAEIKRLRAQQTPVPVEGELPAAWLYLGEPDFDGTNWRENWCVTTDQQVAQFRAQPDSPVPLFRRPAPQPPAEGEVE